MNKNLMELQLDYKIRECEDLANIPHGDMPGDKVSIESSHQEKAKVIFPELLKRVKEAANTEKKVVITVCGGSGVGKSEIASLLTYHFRQMGIGCYTLSGDNYPHRIPLYNDAERLRVFRTNAIRGMIADGDYSEERFEIIHKYQVENKDADKKNAVEYPWYESYLRNGAAGLQGYLGTENEINFSEIQEIVQKFKSGEEKIWLKRMGREDSELWYQEVDFSATDILIIEWTHGNSKNYEGVDIPILLNSTPAETLEHRKSRNRDGAVDSPFTMLVLELEQNLLRRDAHKAQIILSKNGELLTYEDYAKLMDGEENEYGK
ncbi:MAG TPA: zeta toxin family protein [Lachnospiraceae bacterium]